jgi:hypothetical protein
MREPEISRLTDNETRVILGYIEGETARWRSTMEAATKIAPVVCLVVISVVGIVAHEPAASVFGVGGLLRGLLRGLPWSR